VEVEVLVLCRGAGLGHHTGCVCPSAGRQGGSAMASPINYKQSKGTQRRKRTKHPAHRTPSAEEEAWGFKWPASRTPHAYALAFAPKRKERLLPQAICQA
jgi:hypothetical protein